MNVLLWVVGIGATAIALWQFWEYRSQPSGLGFWPHMVMAIVFATIACVCAFVFFYRKRVEEADQDISITKF
jgi:drug/metabolite transporter (DMT)-like permease